MDIEKLLKDYPIYPQEIQKYNAELNNTLQLKIQIQDTLKAQVMTGMPHTYKIADDTYKAVEMSVDKHEHHIKYLCGRIKELYDNKEFIDKALSQLTMEEYRVIDLFYFKEYSMGRVGYIMHYQKSRCYELKDSALKKIKERKKTE